MESYVWFGSKSARLYTCESILPDVSRINRIFGVVVPVGVELKISLSSAKAGKQRLPASSALTEMFNSLEL